jgi:hypothetical protein
LYIYIYIFIYIDAYNTHIHICIYIHIYIYKLYSDGDADFPAGKLLSLEDENTATMLVRSLICIVSMYIDSLRNDKSNVNKNKGMLADNNFKEDKKFTKNIISSHSSSSWVNADLISYLKRLKLLQTEKKIFLSLIGLKDITVCRCVATYVAEEHAEKMIKNYNDINSNYLDVRDIEGKGNINENHVDAEGKGGRGIITALTSDIRRVCALLCVSPFVFAHIIIKQLMAKGASVLAMDVARALGAEDSTASNNSSTQITDNGSIVGSDSTLRGKDIVVLLEAAVTLCSLAVKQVQGGNRSIPSIESITQPFVVSRNLLRGLTAICPVDHLGRTLDILNGSELVLTVYQRVEGAKLDTDNRTKMNINGIDTGIKEDFKINEATFSKDGLLMAPGVILGPILKYAAAEMKRRLYMTVTNVNNISCPIAVDLEESVGIYMYIYINIF